MEFSVRPRVEYKTISAVNNGLITLDRVKDVVYGEIIKVRLRDGTIRTGKIISLEKGRAIAQVFQGTSDVDTKDTSVLCTGDVFRYPVSEDILGRVLNGSGEPIDGGPPIIADHYLSIDGESINPACREYPKDMIESGISTIDGMMSVSQGQKIPLFGCTGLPMIKTAIQILRQARLVKKFDPEGEKKKKDKEKKKREEDEEEAEGEDDDEDVVSPEDNFCVIFCAIGLSSSTARFIQNSFQQEGMMKNAVLILNLASDPTIERIITPRIGLTIAEDFMTRLGKNCLVLFGDVMSYADSLRELSAALDEVPGRRSYPSYMYSDFATLYERSGRIRGFTGSITQIPFLTMPNDDLTHPIPDLTGYITEGQIFMDRKLHNKQIYPPINPLPSLSRLMKAATGPKYTREDHQQVANQLYNCYAIAENVLSMKSVVGEEALTPKDKLYLQFMDSFENRFINQGFDERRTIYETLDLAWEILRVFPKEMLTKIPPKLREKYYSRKSDLKDEDEEDEIM